MTHTAVTTFFILWTTMSMSGGADRPDSDSDDAILDMIGAGQRRSEARLVPQVAAVAVDVPARGQQITKYQRDANRDACEGLERLVPFSDAQLGGPCRQFNRSRGTSGRSSIFDAGASQVRLG